MGSISSVSSSYKEDAGKAVANHEPARHKRGVEVDVHNIAALTQEGMRLRHELDKAWSEANAWGQISTESTSQSRAITLRAELLRANATAAALSNNGLRTELEGSLQESRCLCSEIEDALGIGSIGTAAERAKLRRELDQALSRPDGGAVATTDRERLRVELLEAQSEVSSLQAEFGVARATGVEHESTPISSPKSSKQAPRRRNPSHAGRDSPLHNTNDPKSIPGFGQGEEAAFMRRRDEPVDDEMPRKITPRFNVSDSPKATTSTARGGTSTQPTFRSPTPDRLPTSLAAVQASTTQRAPRDAREGDALHQKTSVFGSSVGKQDMSHPFEHSSQPRDSREKNVMYQKTAAMFEANVGAREQVSMSQRAGGDRGAAAMYAPNLGQASRNPRDDINAMYQKAVGSRDEAVRRQEAVTSQGSREVSNPMYQKAAAAFATNAGAANTGLKAEATDVIYQRAAAAYAAGASKTR